MCVGNYVVVGRMARAARAREPLLVAFAIRHSGRVHQPELLFEPDERNNSGGIGSLEGGDMLVLAPDVVLIGCSQRTTAQTIERVAHEALFPSCPELQRIYVVFMPERRSVMHLDTILTHVDRRVFLGHAPLVTPGDGALAVAQLDRASRVQLLEGASVLDALREAVGDDTLLVPCGGEESLHQEREQWTDGANALTLAPGRIILYARNAYTIAALTEHGFEEVRLHTAQPPQQRTQLITEGMQQGRAVFSFSGSELSRARGGGRCLTMPLARQPHFGCSV
jgi:arginine deiminase